MSAATALTIALASRAESSIIVVSRFPRSTPSSVTEFLTGNRPNPAHFMQIHERPGPFGLRRNRVVKDCLRTNFGWRLPRPVDRALFVARLELRCQLFFLSALVAPLSSRTHKHRRDHVIFQAAATYCCLLKDTEFRCY